MDDDYSFICSVFRLGDAKIFINIGNSDSGAAMFDAHVVEALEHAPEQADLSFLSPEPAGRGSRRSVLPPERAAHAARLRSRRSPGLFLRRQRPPRVALEYASLFEGPSELPAMGHLGKRLAPLLAFAYGLSRIAEWDNRQHVQIIRDSQERLDLI